MARVRQGSGSRELRYLDLKLWVATDIAAEGPKCEGCLRGTENPTNNKKQNHRAPESES